MQLGWHWTPAYGDLATWATAFIALAALVAALLAFLQQGRQIREQQAQLNDQQELNRRQGEVLELQAADLRASSEERVRAQAVLIRVQAYTERSEPDVVMLRVRNLSGLPVFNVLPVQIHGSTEIRPNPVIDKHSGRAPVEIAPSIEPEDAVRSATPPNAMVIRHTVGKTWVLQIADGWRTEAIEVEFRDAAGRWWRADATGGLRIIPPPTQAIGPSSM